MASVYDLAKVADAVYQDSGNCSYNPPKGRGSYREWKREYSSSVKPSGQWLGTQTWAGFYGALFTSGKDAVIAFRGTEFGLTARGAQDIATDADLALGLWTFQIGQAVKFAQTCKSMRSGGRVYFTGHSLGGALALAASDRFHLTTVTYNAPGMSCNDALSLRASKEIHPAEISSSLQVCNLQDLRLNIRVSYDPVSSRYSICEQAGSNVTMPDPRQRPGAFHTNAGQMTGATFMAFTSSISAGVLEGAGNLGTNVLQATHLLSPSEAARQRDTIHRASSQFVDSMASVGGSIGSKVDGAIAKFSEKAKRAAQIITNPVQSHLMGSVMDSIVSIDAAYIDINC